MEKEKAEAPDDLIAECRYCVEGHDRVASSVSDAWVHPATPVGRVVCSYEETPAESALRSLASYVGNGGYNAPRVDAKVFEDKVRSGIETFIRQEKIKAIDEFVERVMKGLGGYANHYPGYCEIMRSVAEEMKL